MQITSVNTAQPEQLVLNGRTITTAINKQPSNGRRISLTRHGLQGDEPADRRVHGGEDKAIYCYANEDYNYWAEQGIDVRPGLFGENLTLEGLDDAAVHIGDYIRVNDALLCVTQPRIPCFKLALWVGAKGFSEMFARSGRPGFYAKVLETGSVADGDSVSVLQRDPKGISVRLVFNLYFNLAKDDEILDTLLRHEHFAQSLSRELDQRLKQKTLI